MGKDLKGKNLGKGITQRKDGRYQARFTNRFGERPTVYGDTLKEVKNALQLEKIADARENNVLNPNLTVDEWFNMWSSSYKEATIKTTTLIKNKRIYKNQIKPIIGKKKISTVTNLDVTKLMSDMSKKYTKGYIRDVHGILYDMFDQAYVNELCKKNPAYKTKYGGKQSKSIQVLSVQEQKDFFEACKDSFYYNAFVVQINTGLRIGELTGLCVQDIDLQNNIIHVNHNLVLIRKTNNAPSHYILSTPKTKSSIRDIPINSLCKKALTDQLNKRQNVTLQNEFKDLIFFTDKHFNPISQSTYHRHIESIVNKINSQKNNGQPLMKTFGSHCFRHTFATRCFEAGIQPKTVQSILGHSSLSMTMDLYTSVLKEKQLEDIEKFNILMNTLCS